jgi:carboxyl-terminal processing protease
MSHRTRLVVALVSVGLLGFVLVGALPYLGLVRVHGDTGYGQLAIFTEVVRLVIDSYVEPVNIDRAMAGARLGMSDALDGDSSYLDPEEFRLYQQPPGEADAEAGLVLTRRFSFVMVVAARPGSPAEKAGLRPGDILKTIDERHTRPMPAVVADRLLRGAPGSSVKLGVLRAGADPFDVTVVRERVLSTAPQGRMLEGGTGYVQVADFGPATAEELRARVEALKRDGAQCLLLDLRGAAWGAPEEGARVAELFLQGGPVAKLVGRRAEESLLQADASRSAWLGPLVALVDNGTAGPGEIVAAALLDAGRAKLVGERTFGRAAVSKPVALPEGGLVLTVAKYMSPKGTSIHGQGLSPSVPVAAEREEDEDLPEGTVPPDRILEKGLEVLKAEGAPQKAAA